MFKAKGLTVAMILVLIISSISGEAQEFRFEVQWNGTTIVFAEVSGLDQVIQQSEYRQIADPYNRLVKTPQANMRSIYLKRGICKRDNELFKWFSTANLTIREKRDITVKLINSNSETVKTWRVIKASPVKVEGPTLIAKGTDVAMETIVLTYEGLEPE
jgi:phage tail-like protein